MLLAASFFSLNEWIKSYLAERDLIDPLTEFVGSLSQPFTFAGSFAVVAVLLASTGILSGNGTSRAFGPTKLRRTA